MLTDLEAVFRSLKSELGLRPIFHRKTDRVSGHLFISVLAYHLVHTIRFQLKAAGIHLSWEGVRRELAGQDRVEGGAIEELEADRLVAHLAAKPSVGRVEDRRVIEGEGGLTPGRAGFAPAGRQTRSHRFIACSTPP